ncbi:MAG: S1-like domain-containing RNA-binding protein [Bacteroidota bacterium]
MIDPGYHYTLTAFNRTGHGMFLTDGFGNEILLPAKNCPADLDEGQKVDVFVYLDSQDRPIATTQQPKIELYGFAYLTCVGTARFGAFVDWGLDRDLLIPTREQTNPMIVGRAYLTYLYLDDRDRTTGTTFIRPALEHEEIDLEIGQEVDLLAYEVTELGVKVIIDNTYGGIMYHSDLYESVKPQDQLKGYVTRIREDLLIDVSPRKFGYRKVLDTTDNILNYLAERGGFASLTDKSDPELIRQELQMSKKVFKKAIGNLYKNHKIAIESDGIRLTSSKQS